MSNYNKQQAELRRTANEKLFASVVEQSITQLNALYPLAYSEQEEIMQKAIAKRTKVEEPWRQQRQKVRNLEAELAKERIILQEVEDQTKLALRKIDEWQHQTIKELLQKIAPSTAALAEAFVNNIINTMHAQKVLFEGDAQELAALRSEKYKAKPDKKTSNNKSDGE